MMCIPAPLKRKWQCDPAAVEPHSGTGNDSVQPDSVQPGGSSAASAAAAGGLGDVDPALSDGASDSGGDDVITLRKATDVAHDHGMTAASTGLARRLLQRTLYGHGRDLACG